MAGGINVGNTTVSLAATLVDRWDGRVLVTSVYEIWVSSLFVFTRLRVTGKEGRTRESCKRVNVCNLCAVQCTRRPVF